MQEARGLPSQVLGAAEQVRTDLQLERKLQALCHTAGPKCKHSLYSIYIEPHPLIMSMFTSPTS